MTTAAHKPLRIFCSYSHRDEEYLNQLRTWLRGLERQGLIEWWHDRKISPGWEWEEAIDKNLRTADVVLLLVTPDFMASDYVFEKELGKAVERHKRGQARVIPIIVRPADWEGAPLDRLQALPKDAKPITTWLNRDEAWLDVARGIRRAVQELLVERQERAATKDRYRKAVEEAWADNKISDTEAGRLSALASEHGLNADVAANIEREVMNDTVEAVLQRQRRFDELYARARRFHRDQEWQAVIDVFGQIHDENPSYQDSEGLLNSAREALRAQQRAGKPVATEAAKRKAAELRIDLSQVEGSGSRGLITVKDVMSAANQSSPRIPRSIRDDSPADSAQQTPVTTRITTSSVDLIRCLRVLEGHTDTVTSVAFSPHGELLASGSHDKTVRLWQVRDGEFLGTLGEHTEEVNSVAFSPDGRLLASGSDGWRWRLESGSIGQEEQDHHTLWLWHLDSRGLLWARQHQSRVLKAAFSPDGELLATDAVSEVPLWQVEGGIIVRTLNHTQWHLGLGRRFLRSLVATRDTIISVVCVSFSPDGLLLASGADNKMVWIWRVEDGTLLHTLEGHTETPYSVAFSPDGALLASASYDQTVRLWRVRDGTLLHTLGRGNEGLPDSVAFSSDGRLLASSSSSGTVPLWRVEDGAHVRSLEGHASSVQSVAFSPDGRLLASGSSDKTVRLWGIA
jgi:WD40 repeat protein